MISPVGKDYVSVDFWGTVLGTFHTWADAFEDINTSQVMNLDSGRYLTRDGFNNFMEQTQ